MKLQAAILFAATNAQRDGRVRDKEVSVEDSSFSDYFNSEYDFGADSYSGFDTASYEAFGDDSFGDLSFGDYDASYDASAVAADEGRPVEEVAVDDGKSTFEQGVAAAVADSSADAVFSERCFNGIGNDAAAWLNAGAWERCPGETQACEIKVVRRGGAITQIQSKCANQFSCVNNMKQNFNPGKKLAVASTWHQTFGQQSCRPLVLATYTAADIGPRLSNSDSTCFFCLEPCSDGTVSGFNNGGVATVASAADMKTAQCVGKANSFTNTEPISGSALNILGTEAQLNVAPAGLTIDAAANNFYSVVDVTMTVTIDTHTYTDKRTVSYIQKDQKSF